MEEEIKYCSCTYPDSINDIPYCWHCKSKIRKLEPEKCEACRIEKYDEMVKQMPVHTCTQEYKDSVKDLLEPVK